MALLLALVTFCARIIFFTLRINWKTNALGSFSVYFMVVVLWCHLWGTDVLGNFALILSFIELGDGNQHILNNFCMPGTMLDALPCLNSLNLNS